LLERELSRYRLDLATLRKQGQLDTVLHALSFTDEETLLAALGYGQVTAGNVLSFIVPQADGVQGQTADTVELEKIKQRPAGENKSAVRVGGIGDVLVRFGRCCNPLPGDPIRGVITRGKGVTVHTGECHRLLESDPQRHVEVSWENGAHYVRPVKIEVLCEDRPGLLAAMSKAISATGLNISSADVRTLPDKRARDVFEVIVGSAEELDRVMRNLGRVRGVVKVTRMRT
jgi:GTP pyrophosphokinase